MQGVYFAQEHLRVVRSDFLQTVADCLYNDVSITSKGGRETPVRPLTACGRAGSHVLAPCAVHRRELTDHSSSVGVCPRPAPVCLTARNFASPPTQCYGDSECASTDKCCHDTCLQHRVCKTADYVSTRPLLNRFNNRYATRGGRQYDDATTTSQSFSDLVRHADSDIQADDDGPVVTSSGRVTSDDPAGSSSGSQSSSGSFKFE